MKSKILPKRLGVIAKIIPIRIKKHPTETAPTMPSLRLLEKVVGLSFNFYT
jgi:hypothetical protein